tara:strand:+ start:287 stop:550 length:264 start_codon:yes stop_codon:yes gene_type:complete
MSNANWYRHQMMKERFVNFTNRVENAMTAVGYSYPDFDFSTASMEEIISSLNESGYLPSDIDPERFAMACQLHARIGREAIWEVLNN